MKRFAVLGALCVAVLAFAGGAFARTNNQAYLKAHACLVSHGAKQVRPQSVVPHRQPANIIYEGGWANVHGSLVSWFYHPDPVSAPDWHPQVTSVSVAIGHGWPAQARTMVITCAQSSLGLGPAGRVSVTEE